MARKRYSDKDALKILREIDVHLLDGLDVVRVCCKAGISNKTYYYWRKTFGGLGRPQLSEMKALKNENARQKKIVADLPLDKTLLKERLDNLKPMGDGGELIAQNLQDWLRRIGVDPSKFTLGAPE